jgi:hypothetical protein
MTTETTPLPQPGALPRPEPATSPRLRASTPEREETVARLHHALGEGRLDLEETETRVAAAYAARYRDELPPLLADLPDHGPAADRTGSPGWPDLWVYGVWRARTTLTGTVGERPTPAQCRTAALVTVMAVLWVLFCAVLGAAAVG